LADDLEVVADQRLFAASPGRRWCGGLPTTGLGERGDLALEVGDPLAGDRDQLPTLAAGLVQYVHLIAAAHDSRWR